MKWTSRLVEQLVPAQMFDAVLGDLAEEYALRHQGTSRARASQWYWGQLIRSALPMMWLDVRR